MIHSCVLYSNNRLIDVNATFGGQNIFLMFVSGDLVVKQRELVWERLIRIETRKSEPWLMIEILIVNMKS